MISAQTLAYAEQVTTALLGVDALYRRESGDADGLAVLNMSAGRHPPEPLAGYDTAAQRFKDLQQQAATLPEADRQRYYDQLCTSTLAFMGWRQGRLNFMEQLSSFLHVPAEPAADSELDQLRGQMREKRLLLQRWKLFDGLFNLGERAHGGESRTPHGESSSAGSL